MPMSYDTSSLQFTFYSMDSNLAGQFEFSLAAHLKDYPTNATPPKAEIAYISIADPCADALSITASTMTDQSYTITQTAKQFQFSAFETSPPNCEATYTFRVVPEP